MKTKTELVFWIFPVIALAFSGLPAAEQKNTGAAEPDQQRQQFFDAIKKGDIAKVKELRKQTPALATASNQKGITATLYAVYAGHKEIAELFISSGVEPNIFEAAATGRIDRVRQLLDKDPQLAHAYSPDGWTALHLANFDGIDLVKLLLDRGADINAISRNGLVATPLQGTVVMKKIEFGRLFLDRGANVSPRGEEGTTPLHEAAGSGQLEFAKLLLERGADVNAKDDAGTTPLAIALEFKQPEVAEFLRQHGGR
ncbi:MAG: ankyrin repeat domain-containing protein [Chthoniobacterales bacterium]